MTFQWRFLTLSTNNSYILQPFIDVFKEITNHVFTVYYSVVGLKIAHFTVVCLSTCCYFWSVIFMSCNFLSCNFMSCNFMSCNLVRHFHVLQFRVLQFHALRFWWSIIFTSCIFSQPVYSLICQCTLSLGLQFTEFSLTATQVFKLLSALQLALSGFKDTNH